MFEKKEDKEVVSTEVFRGGGPQDLAVLTDEQKLTQKMKSVKGPIEVVATRQGYYDHQLKEVGDRFVIKSGADFGTWMEKVGASVEDTHEVAPSKVKK